MKVREVMTTRVVSVETNAPFSELVEAMTEGGISGLPVVDSDGHVVGVVSEADLIVKGHRGRATRVRGPQRARSDGRRQRRVEGVVAGELMTTPAVTVDEDADLRTAARLLSLHAIKRVPVTSDGRLVGILSRRDVLKAFKRPDEEIHRAISDDIIGAKVLDAAHDVRVDVTDGVVTLEGNVERRSTAQLIRFHVDRLDGVTKVVDALLYRVDDTKPAPVRIAALGPIEYFV